MPCFLASAQVIRPLPLSSHCATSAGNSSDRPPGLMRSATGAPPRTRDVEAQDASTWSRALASRRSIVRRYFWRTRSTRSANQHRFRSGNHAAASRSFFCPRFTPGLARVRFREVRGETPARLRRGRAQATVMRFRPRHHMLDVGLPPAREGTSGIGAPDPSEALDNPCFNRLRVGIARCSVGAAA